MSKIGLTRPTDLLQSPRRCACARPSSSPTFHVRQIHVHRLSPAATTTVSLGNKTFVLDREKAEARLRRQARDQRQGNHVLQPPPAEIPVGLRPLQDDEGQPLGARGHHHAEGRRAVALRRDHRHRALDHQDGHRLFLRRRRHRRRQRPARRPRGGHRPRAEARARPPRPRGKHPRRQPALHDFLARHQPARVRGDVRGDPDHRREKRVRRLRTSQGPAPRPRPHRSPKTSSCSPRTSSSSASAWKAPSSTASSA